MRSSLPESSIEGQKSPSTRPRPSACVSALQLLETNDQNSLSTGVYSIDRLLEKRIPRSKITEIWGEVSSGRTSLAFSILASATHNGELAAFIDAFNTFDARSARTAGIQLDRLLWVRCGAPQSGLAFNAGSGSTHSVAIARALKAADILSRSKGFAAVILDLSPPVGRKGAAQIPYSHWFRLQRSVKRSPAAFLVLSGEKSLTGGASALSLSFKKNAICWSNPGPSNKCRRTLLEGVKSQVVVARGQNNESAPIHCRF